MADQSHLITVDVSGLGRAFDNEPPRLVYRDRVGMVELGDVAPTAPIAEPARFGELNGHMLASRRGGACTLFKPLGHPPRWVLSHMVRLGQRRARPATIYSSWLRPWSR